MTHSRPLCQTPILPLPFSTTRPQPQNHPGWPWRGPSGCAQPGRDPPRPAPRRRPPPRASTSASVACRARSSPAAGARGWRRGRARGGRAAGGPRARRGGAAASARSSGGRRRSPSSRPPRARTSTTCLHEQERGAVGRAVSWAGGVEAARGAGEARDGGAPGARSVPCAFAAVMIAYLHVTTCGTRGSSAVRHRVAADVVALLGVQKPLAAIKDQVGGTIHAERLPLPKQGERAARAQRATCALRRV